MSASTMAAIASSTAVVAPRAGCSGRNKQQASMSSSASSCFAGPGLGKMAMVAMRERRDHSAVRCTYTPEKVVVNEEEVVKSVKGNQRPDSFGGFRISGGKYVPETLMAALSNSELEVVPTEEFQVRPLHSGTATLKGATSEAIRDWGSNVETSPDFGISGAKFCRLGAIVTAERGAPDELVPKAGERVEISRRNLFTAAFAAAAAALPLVRTSPASATSFRQYKDRFDGYSFSYPEGWIQVRGAGADVFFRDPVNLDENVVVEFSSPSSSRYERVEDLGTPEEAAQRILKQYLTEFMSTRIGVRRESNILSSKSRIGDDGRLYYDIEVNVKSFANTNQLAVMPENRVAKLEWSRRYLSVLGVENKRLYELRLQTPERVLLEEESDLRQMMNSFRLVKLDA